LYIILFYFRTPESSTYAKTSLVIQAEKTTTTTTKKKETKPSN